MISKLAGQQAESFHEHKRRYPINTHDDEFMK